MHIMCYRYLIKIWTTTVGTALLYMGDILAGLHWFLKNSFDQTLNYIVYVPDKLRNSLTGLSFNLVFYFVCKGTFRD